MKKSRERAAGGKEGLSKSRAATNSTDIFALSRRSALGVVFMQCLFIPLWCPQSKIKCLYSSAPAWGLKDSCGDDNLSFPFSLPPLQIDYRLHLEGKVNSSASQR